MHMTWQRLAKDGQDAGPYHGWWLQHVTWDVGRDNTLNKPWYNANLLCSCGAQRPGEELLQRTVAAGKPNALGADLAANDLSKPAHLSGTLLLLDQL
eukprot:CAMPEP_0179205758 /NCGR_PEP_ID=MMETSP0796-20121207/102580_1 /TAXON_ID=73915 /ORGANISM="Pyrodinium bahamense, Strain pbaha01" /LENGTH=96 /DNA_ID=CAMNT_0020910649 /DNA_START=238 /DNA_END=528 /DNA_ORIENTATION=+